MNFYPLTEEQIEILNNLIIYLITSSGQITEKEKETIFILNNNFKHENIFFLNQLLERKYIYNELISQLNSIDNEQVIFYIIFQSLLIYTNNGLNEYKKSKISDLLSNSSISIDKIFLLYDIFINNDFYNKKNILLIGNDPIKDDFVLSIFDIQGIIVFIDNNYFIFFKNITLGNLTTNITINNNFVIESLFYKLNKNDIIYIENNQITFEDIVFRYELKNNKDMYIYSFVKENNVYKLIPGLQNKSYGSIIIEGSHVVIENLPYKEYLIFENNSFNGSIDNTLYINNSYKIILSKYIFDIIKQKDILLEPIYFESILIGNFKFCDIILDEDEEHILLYQIEKEEKKKWDLIIICSTYDVYLNNIKVIDKVQLKDMDIIRINNHYLTINITNNIVSYSKTQIYSIEVNNLSYSFFDKKVGLHNLSFYNNSSDLVCIMGPSGSGKSTLIKILSGFIKNINKDSVLYNNLSFQFYFSRFKYFIGYVSQDDVLFENCTVFDNLYHYGKIKNPFISKKNLIKRIDEILIQVNLIDKKYEIVGSINKRILSGGERKRLNIALELLSDADILILDEPTSGLSSYDSEKIIELLYELTKVGKIIYVVIHQPSREIFLRFSHLLLLDRGGYLIYFGKTNDSFYYFSKFAHNNKYPKTPDDIIAIVEDVKKGPDGKILYDTKSKHKKAIRVRSPEQLNNIFEIYQKSNILNINKNKEKFLPHKKEYTILDKFKQFYHLFLRNIKNKFGDLRFVIFSIILPILLSFISFILKYNTETTYLLKNNINIPKFLFLSSIIIIFLGISNSINDILNDRVIINKEKLIGYSNFFYVLAKLFTLLLISIYQIIIYITISFVILKIPILSKPYFFIKFLFFSIISSISITSVGLFFSSFLKSEKQAFLMVPVFMVPQIVLGGLFINFNEINSISLIKGKPIPEICDIIHTRWMFESYLSLFQEENIYNKEINKIFNNYNFIQNEKDNKKKYYPVVNVYNRRLKFIKENKLSIFDYFNKDLYIFENINIFPSNKKIFYIYIINTYTYNLVIIIFWGILFFSGAVLKLKFS